MHIVLVEDDYLEHEMAVLEIRLAIPTAKITHVKNVGDFLLEADAFRDADIVVMEHYLPLGENGASEEENEAWFKNVSDRFPEVVEKWDHQQGGERLVRWMRKNGMNTPILFHTHSYRERIAADVREDPKVFHSQKGSNTILGIAVREKRAGAKRV